MAPTPVDATWEIVSPGPLQSVEELTAAARPTPGPSLSELQKLRRNLSQAEARRMQALLMQERALQELVRVAGRDGGWKHYHTHNSRFSEEGFQDSTMLRNGRLVVIECKTELARVPSKQLEWLLEWLNAGAEVFILRPSGWPAMQAVLR